MNVSTNTPARENSVSALLVGEFSADRLLLHDVFRQCGWRLFEARDRRRTLQCLDRIEVQVVIAESELPRWNWRRLLYDLRRLARQPQLIVTSRQADDCLWAEVLNVGGYDLLRQPFAREEVERVVASARRQYDRERREPLVPAILPAAGAA